MIYLQVTDIKQRHITGQTALTTDPVFFIATRVAGQAVQAHCIQAPLSRLS